MLAEQRAARAWALQVAHLAALPGAEGARIRQDVLEQLLAPPDRAPAQDAARLAELRAAGVIRQVPAE